ncbi:hypothetical protein [Maribacter sp. 2210JD10-5]|uniref:hypothetical protein n=1 Tax=Maribacter sp. 2210JD10-5 TaxID=3386272 RepID=UPI0039BD25D4
MQYIIMVVDGKSLKHRNFKLISIWGITIIVLVLSLQFITKFSINQFIHEKIPSHIEFTYEKLDFNILTGNLCLSNVDLRISDRDSTQIHTDLKADHVNLLDLGYSQFFFGNRIEADQLIVENPRIHYLDSNIEKNSTGPKGVVNLLKEIRVEKIAITNGRFNFSKRKNDSLNFQVNNFNVTIVNGRTGPKTITERIPFKYDDYRITGGEINMDMGGYETLTLQKIVLSKSEALLKNLTLKSKYSKKVLSQIIQKEHDHINLSIPEFHLQGIDIGVAEEEFYFNSEYGKILRPNLNIHRDKSLPDNIVKKQMYGTILKEIPMRIRVDSLFIKKGEVRYEEKLDDNTAAGSILFDDLAFEMYNIANDYAVGENTVVKITGKLSGTAPFTMDYRFDMNNDNDAFTLKASLFNLKGEKVNSFLRPNLNAQVLGEVNEMYFNVFGNDISARGDIKMKYENLEFEMLKKDGFSVNKIFSAIGNLFINDGSKTDEDGYRYGKIDVERNPNKSFFNYTWIITQDGLISVLTGDGEKVKN